MVARPELDGAILIVGLPHQAIGFSVLRSVVPRNKLAPNEAHMLNPRFRHCARLNAI